MTSLSFLFLIVCATPGVLDGNQEALLPIEKAAVASIHLEGFPDWLEIGFGSLWEPGRRHRLEDRPENKRGRGDH
jgi:hypothetical protein